MLFELQNQRNNLWIFDVSTVFEVFVHWPIYPTWNKQGWEPIHKKYKENKSIRTQVTKEQNNGDPTNTLTCTWVSNIGSAKALVHFLSHSCPVAWLKCVWWSPDTHCFCPDTFGHHPYFLGKIWIRLKADSENRSTALPSASSLQIVH
jgi:hypothetical protein